jgi:hypothetical protein
MPRKNKWGGPTLADGVEPLGFVAPWKVDPDGWIYFEFDKDGTLQLREEIRARARWQARAKANRKAKEAAQRKIDCKKLRCRNKAVRAIKNPARQLRRCLELPGTGATLARLIKENRARALEERRKR